MNEKHLNKFIETAKNKGCPRDQVANFINASYVPQPKQLEFHAAARLADVQGGPDMIAMGGARGGSKSHGILAQAGLDDAQRFPGLKILYLRKVGKSSRESFEDLVTKVLSGIEHTYTPSRSRLEFPNGSRFVLGGFQNENDIDAYLGIEYDLIIVEEATQLSKAKIDKLRGSLRSSKPGWRERLYVSTNPGGIGHAWFKAMFITPWRKHEEGYTRFIPATYRDNKYLSESYIRYLEGLTGWLGKAWRDGDWDIAAGQYFTNWQHGKHVVKPEHIPTGLRYWLSLDYGFTHYTTVYLLGEDGDGNVFFVDEHAERRWLPPSHVDAVKAMLARHNIDTMPRCVAGTDVFANRGTPKTIADQYAELGMTLHPAQNDRVSGAAKFLQMLGDEEQGIEQKIFISEKCPMLIECMPSLEHDPHRPEDVLKVDTDDDGNGGDDAYDGARYGLMEAGNTAVVMDNLLYD